MCIRDRHLIDAEKIHQAVEKMVESLDRAAGSTTNFDLYMVVENDFKAVSYTQLDVYKRQADGE